MHLLDGSNRCARAVGGRHHQPCLHSALSVCVLVAVYSGRSCSDRIERQRVGCRELIERRVLLEQSGRTQPVRLELVESALQLRAERARRRQCRGRLSAPTRAACAPLLESRFVALQYVPIWSAV